MPTQTSLKTYLENYQKWHRHLIIKEEREFFKKHLRVFVIINAVSFSIYFAGYAAFALFLIPFLWWGSILFGHYLWAVHFLEKRVKKKEEKAAKLTIQKMPTQTSLKTYLENYQKGHRHLIIKEEKFFFKGHLILFVIINLISFSLYLTGYIHYLFFLVPLVWWGLGLLAHYLGAVHFLEKRVEKKEAKAAELMKQKSSS